MEEGRIGGDEVGGETKKLSEIVKECENAGPGDMVPPKILSWCSTHKHKFGILCPSETNGEIYEKPAFVNDSCCQIENVFYSCYGGFKWYDTKVSRWRKLEGLVGLPKFSF